MNVTSAKWGLPAVVAIITLGGAAWAEGTNAPAVPARELQAKIRYCSTCHGAKGQGYRGATAIPRLAGQQVEYFKNQMHAFDEHRRSNKYMFDVAHALSPEMLQSLAEYFNGLNAKPSSDASRDLIPAGQKIFQEGIPETGVPACASCHGADAKGNGAFPRLAGQSHEYIQNSLTTWERVRGQDPKNPDNSALMQPILHGLNPAQISAVAAYLDFLE